VAEHKSHTRISNCAKAQASQVNRRVWHTIGSWCRTLENGIATSRART